MNVYYMMNKGMSGGSKAGNHEFLCSSPVGFEGREQG